MGEYAIYNGEEIKIGTCENMYYIRYTDRHKVTPIPGNVNPREDKDLFWRLPLFEEDGMKPGSYISHESNSILKDWDINLDDDGIPNIMQLAGPSGILANVTCYHGMKLPRDTEEAQYFWNGKAQFLAVCALKNTDEGLRLVVRCRFCNAKWSFNKQENQEILNHMVDQDLAKRLKEMLQ